MSELQLGLLLIGAIVVLAVLTYNKWQEIRYRRQTEQAFGPGQDDVLMDARQGNGHGPDAAVEKLVSEDPDRIEPPFSAAEVAETGESDPDQSPIPAASAAEEESLPADPVLSGALDYIIEMEAAEHLSGANVISIAAKFLQNFSKPVFLEICRDGSPVWSRLKHRDSGSRLRAGLQLADRQGAASAEEIDRFTHAVSLLAVDLGAKVAVEQQGAAHARARDLDHFCGEVDIQIALNVVADSKPFSGPALRDFAIARGFFLRDDGRFCCLDRQGREVCTMHNAESAAFVPGTLDSMKTGAVTFELDVTRAPGGLQAFDNCVDLARGFAGTLGGQLADDNGALLTEGSLLAIRAQLEPIYAAMIAQGIPAGSTQALRLFS